MLPVSITRGVFSLSLPIMIMNVLQSLFSIVDMAVLKNYDFTGTAVETRIKRIDYTFCLCYVD